MTLCKALVIEPDKKTRETIEDILTTMDYSYEIADSLAQARKMLARSEYDLILPAFDMPSRTGSKPRPQNAEHFMLSLRKARARNMPKVIMLITDRPTVRDVNIARWAFDMRDLGVSAVVDKPLADEGRTLDRVIKKVMELLDEEILIGPALPRRAPATRSADASDTSDWLTVTQAAKLLAHDLPSLDLRKARSRISTAAGRKEFKFAGARKNRRIAPNSFAAWRLKQRDRDLDQEDEEDDAS